MLALVQLGLAAPRSAVWNTPTSVPIKRLLEGASGSNATLFTGMSKGRPTPISVQVVPILVDLNTCRWPLPAVLVNPETVTTTVIGSMGDTATAVNGRPGIPGGVIGEKVAGMLVALALTHAFGPVAPLEPVTT